jgi:hypothetical protein
VKRSCLRAPRPIPHRMMSGGLECLGELGSTSISKDLAPLSVLAAGVFHVKHRGLMPLAHEQNAVDAAQGHPRVRVGRVRPRPVAMTAERNAACFT